MKRFKSGCPATRVVMMPRDTNGMGNIFGGVILSHIDLAGAVGARHVCSNRIVTVAMKEVVFKKPVQVGDLLTCWAEVTRVGRTSIEVHVEVEVQRNRDGETIPVTEATVTYVAVDEKGRPTPIQLYEGVKVPRRAATRKRCGSCVLKRGSQARLAARARKPRV